MQTPANQVDLPSMHDRHYDVLIVGAGHGGAQAAASLRQRRFNGSIGILGAEPDLPYERPPLSKDYLAGEKSFERILIRPATFWLDRKINVMRARRVASINPTARAVITEEGALFGYRKLVWATGGTPRRLACEGHSLGGVLTLRTRADADAIVSQVQQVKDVVVIGGGYIGLETAAVLSKLGKHVTVLESQGRVLARVAGEVLSRFYESEHRAHGVEFRLDATVVSIEEDGGRASGVHLASGEVVPAQLVIVGIGIIPAVQPLLTARAKGGNGVLVDEFCRTSLPDVFAIGDCALHPNQFAGGELIRLESIQNATDMADTVALAITGEMKAYRAVPWFWSNQYDLKLQTVGLSIRHDEVVIRGEPAARSFSIIYRKRGRVVALDCVNAVKDFVQGKALVMSGSAANSWELADTSVPLKQLCGACAEPMKADEVVAQP